MRRIKQIQGNKENRTIRRSLTKYVLFTVAGILAISSIFMTVETATSSVEVSTLRQKEAELSMEKRNLENTLVRSLSMSDLEGKGNELGFTKPQAVVYVSGSEESVAKLP
ncbi:MAG: hypothetical protein UU51_C0013G0006 [Microgenomates group bacterium GW2011_GWC1_41_20]|uniref:Cell division protein FtsL n=5 Tax=Candidatus Woeseibacteriota TaxID=1752722 RepID=A0A1F8DIQ3_9BACT|nr:MAG: hypothetical protein UU39_C0020G0003 [Candidatus Woesebacteria bacterium GW2011_GWD1_41_12]KKS00271.1 MAG: hypothetical protein UU51_C0013G0006 [Microgenomates group bacterium GW2011_GWC1_41_20]KKS04670.1 MAG: hypothetical protein UU57_C0018G0002 [Candidatus Woesebacteria bacterium GW2011_GWE1_41_24]OGM81022.1 MAG: hypothetical protein A2393_02010 [Candidatus Woesebacteria bacterium RIFOXYB1_FULL_41_13]OGM84196.1 MAG: hypothetical protein A2434_03345 [Candidatus Woesebacteria bacterium 